jgi:hypothetical protein
LLSDWSVYLTIGLHMECCYILDQQDNK